MPNYNGGPMTIWEVTENRQESKPSFALPENISASALVSSKAMQLCGSA